MNRKKESKEGVLFQIGMIASFIALLGMAIFAYGLAGSSANITLYGFFKMISPFLVVLGLGIILIVTAMILERKR
jgi:hypothetical protein